MPPQTPIDAMREGLLGRGAPRTATVDPGGRARRVRSTDIALPAEAPMDVSAVPFTPAAPDALDPQVSDWLARQEGISRFADRLKSRELAVPGVEDYLAETDRPPLGEPLETLSPNTLAIIRAARGDSGRRPR